MTWRSSWSWRSGSRSCITARSWPKARRRRSSRTRGCSRSISRHERGRPLARPAAPGRGHPHLLREESYPEWRLARSRAWRGGRAARPERGRQEHDAEGDCRAGASERRPRRVRWPADHQYGGAPAGAAGDRLCAGRPPHLSAADRHRKSADRPRSPRGDARPQKAIARQGLRLFPGACRAAQPGRRHPVGRRAADAGDRPRDDAGAEDHPAGRADRRLDAAHGVADPRDHRCPARGTGGGIAGRAERAADAGRRSAHLHHRKGRRPPPRAGRRFARQRRRHPSVHGSVSRAMELLHAVPWDLLLIQTINGIVTGMILALVASGLTLIFGIMDVVNFAHGEFLMLGAYIAVLTIVATHNFWLALIIASLGTGLIGALVYVTTLRPLLGRDPLTTILATFGVSLVLQNYALWQFGPVARKIPEPFSGSITLFHLDYSLYRLMIAGLSAAIIGGFWLFLKFGTWGIWIRATTQDRIMAQAMGIPVPWVLAGVFAIGSAMAGASGVLFGPLVGVDHAMGFDWILRAFIVVVVGGMGSLGGSVLAAIFISLLEAYSSLWVSPAQAGIISFVVLILTLLFRPTGLFVATPK